ncbi:hypothetical protein P9112_009536 [Eukaryota sp. TZLM1-RC]
MICQNHLTTVNFELLRLGLVATQKLPNFQRNVLKFLHRFPFDPFVRLCCGILLVEQHLIDVARQIFYKPKSQNLSSSDYSKFLVVEFLLAQTESKFRIRAIQKSIKNTPWDYNCYKLFMENMYYFSFSDSKFAEFVPIFADIFENNGSFGQLNTNSIVDLIISSPLSQKTNSIIDSDLKLSQNLIKCGVKLIKAQQLFIKGETKTALREVRRVSR